ncbi:MAG TPA: hypothetical protein VIV40_37580 [Kofleriaceae bacterium]
MRHFIAALLVTAACATAPPAEPFALPAAPPPGPWQVMRDALDQCAQSYGVAGDLVVRVELDDLGKVRAVDAQQADGMSSCIGNALLRTRYRAYRNRALLISFHTGT